MERVADKVLLDHYRAMLRIRRIEEAVADRYPREEMRCPLHLCIGQEAIAVGVCSVLRRDDVVFSNHRAHGHYLAKGGSLNAMMAELFGRTTGCCGGRGGSMHLIDLDVGFMGATPIVGGTVPLGVGAAWAARLQNLDRVSTVFFGDGCIEEGVVHEAMNFAAVQQLPVMFVCENNEFSVYTRLEERQPDRPLHQLAQGHGLTVHCGDGNDVQQVAELAAAAVTGARAGKGPQFLELKTYRWREHCGPNFDHELKYRSEVEIDSGMRQCPIERTARLLLQADPAHADHFARCEAEIAEEIAEAFRFAQESPKPTPASAREGVYA